jgi:hypothetical protein
MVVAKGRLEQIENSSDTQKGAGAVRMSSDLTKSGRPYPPGGRGSEGMDGRDV